MMAENKINSSDILVPLSPEKVEGLKKPLSGETGTVSWDFYTGFNAGVDATVQAIGVQNNLVELEVEKLAVYLAENSQDDFLIRDAYDAHYCEVIGVDWPSVSKLICKRFGKPQELKEGE